MLIWFLPNKKEVLEEINYWMEKNKIFFSRSRFLSFTYLISRYKEYRNLLKYRFDRNNLFIRIIGNVVLIFLPPMESLKIYADEIGRNFYIEHGIGTIISAESIGDNCWINQQVTLGYNLDNRAPIIKNGVRICAGAKVIGGIIVGNNVIVGANAVVTKSIDENCIVAGVPAEVIKRNCKHILWNENFV